MADRLTQLQDSIDDLLLRMYATLNYIQSYHPYGEIHGQPNHAPHGDEDDRKGSTARVVPVLANGNAQASSDAHLKSEDATPGPDTKDKFQNTLRELARDLVLQEQTAEILINQLPGLGNNERDQIRRMQELEVELTEVETARAEAEKQKTEMLNRLDNVLSGFKRIR